ncbi:MAG: SCO family protein [Nitrospirae bacterium]|nr:SCO family protein [Nitrospirota bacterium]
MLVLLLAGLVAPLPASAGITQDPEDAVLKEIGVDERLGARVPMDAVLTNQDGKKVRLGDYFTGRPVILSLNYYECPMLCPLTFSSLSHTIDGMGGLKLGRDFRVVTVSFNPAETLDMARDKSATTYGMLKGVDDPGAAWPFLFGGAAETSAITKAVGFRFKELGPGNFAHPSALIILSPDGRVMRYLYGIRQEPFDLRLALTEAADGKVGHSHALNNVLLFCFDYDPAGRKYALAATRVMTALGVVTVVCVGGLLVAMRRKERSKTKSPL